MNNIQSMIVLVTPTMAQKWLEKNINNRRIRPTVVNSYAKDMKDGRWTINNDAITFDKKGILTNGQHRLNAIIESNTSQYMMVMYGIEHNVNMDRPVTRSLSDNLSIFTDIPEILTKTNCVSVCNFLRKYINDESYSKRSGYGLYDFVKKNQNNLMGFFTNIAPTAAGHKARAKFTTSGVLSAFFLAYINGVSIELLNNMKK